jgi:peptidoglycan hydrolase-like protein with peptidoglycan-binding domain
MDKTILDWIELHLDSLGGMAATHPPHLALSVLAGPTSDDEFNTIRDGLLPIACWRMNDVRFEFDSSFVKPEAKEEFAHFAKLKETFKDSPVSIFGHADPVGNDNYNKQLSGRRVKAIYGVLTRNAALWEELYKEPFEGDKWGTVNIQIMLADLGFLYKGMVGSKTDKADAETKKAVEDFQGSPEGTAVGLKVDGDPGPKTRPVLYKAYMDHICRHKDGRLFQLDPVRDFLTRAADKAGLKGDIQACSEFNPILIFSENDDKRFKDAANKKSRDAANVGNRRVVAFLFRPGTVVRPEDWPCPVIKKGASDPEGIKVCNSRFWSDHEQRRTSRLPDEAREYIKTRDTFACRFYDRLARRSPCEAGFKEWVLRILNPPPLKRDHKTKTFAPAPLTERETLANEPFVVTGAGGPQPEISGTTDANGVLRFKMHNEVATMKLQIAGVEITLKGGELPEINAGPEAIKERLFNLGYGKANFQDWDAATELEAFKQFQRDHGLDETGAADNKTTSKLKEMYGS